MIAHGSMLAMSSGLGRLTAGLLDVDEGAADGSLEAVAVALPVALPPSHPVSRSAGMARAARVVEIRSVIRMRANIPKVPVGRRSSRVTPVVRFVAVGRGRG